MKNKSLQYDVIIKYRSVGKRHIKTMKWIWAPNDKMAMVQAVTKFAHMFPYVSDIIDVETKCINFWETEEYQAMQKVNDLYRNTINANVKEFISIKRRLRWKDNDILESLENSYEDILRMSNEEMIIFDNREAEDEK